jgi:hypothetical protein
VPKSKVPRLTAADGLYWQLRQIGQDPAREVEFFTVGQRRWKFDFAFMSRRLAIEVEGGSWVATNTPGAKARHTAGAGFREDCLKYGVAALQGWTVLRFTVDMIRSGGAIGVIDRVLRGDLLAAAVDLSAMSNRPVRRRKAVR